MWQRRTTTSGSASITARVPQYPHASRLCAEAESDAMADFKAAWERGKKTAPVRARVVHKVEDYMSTQPVEC